MDVIHLNLRTVSALADLNTKEGPSSVVGGREGAPSQLTGPPHVPKNVFLFQMSAINILSMRSLHGKVLVF